MTTIHDPSHMEANEHHESTDHVDQAGGDNLDVVRNILFGEQIKHTEEKRMELERLLELSVNSLREENEKKFARISQELSTLVNLLTDETKARQTEFNHTRNTFNHVSHQISQLEVKTQKAQSQLQEQILNESSKANQNIKRVNEELSLKIEHAVEQLRHEKADRKAISNLLSGVAKQLLDNDERT